MTRFLIADDHPLFRDALSATIQQGIPDCQIQTAESIDSVKINLDANGEPDLLLLDLKMPGSDGFFGLVHLREHYPALPVVVISAMEDPATIQRALSYGAIGFIPKSSASQTMVQGLMAVLEGETWLPDTLRKEVERLSEEEKDFAERVGTLTDQQFRVLMQLTEGRLNKQIAYDLNISEATVKAHITAIFRKLGVQNRTQAVIAASRLRLDDQ